MSNDCQDDTEFLRERLPDLKRTGSKHCNRAQKEIIDRFHDRFKTHAWAWLDEHLAEEAVNSAFDAFFRWPPVSGDNPAAYLFKCLKTAIHRVWVRTTKMHHLKITQIEAGKAAIVTVADHGLQGHEEIHITKCRPSINGVFHGHLRLKRKPKADGVPPKPDKPKFDVIDRDTIRLFVSVTAGCATGWLRVRRPRLEVAIPKITNDAGEDETWVPAGNGEHPGHERVTQSEDRTQRRADAALVYRRLRKYRDQQSRKQAKKDWHQIGRTMRFCFGYVCSIGKKPERPAMTQEEAAAKLMVTARTVRYRIEKAKEILNGGP